MAEMKTYSSQKFEKRDLIQTIHKMDLINRPYMLICHPEKINEVTAALANIPEKDKFLVKTDPAAGMEEIYLIKREELEKINLEISL